ncbi:MAG: 23S rRNA (uracil(1939)-C(5))-methyltransferase RlmD [Lachnospiraceae bacterium]|nr:23S rRNA (uracil(1939)-C(5))-methyltransferase RlmD [Lachnospiraceae bacterium]
MSDNTKKCIYADKCGGCDYQGIPYKKQLEMKQQYVTKLLAKHCKTPKITGMDKPYNYRNKVHAVFDVDKKGNVISGVYEANTHNVICVDKCQIENEKADAIILTIRNMLKSFKIRTYDEDRRTGLLRHVLIRTAHKTGQIIVVLVMADQIFPGKNNFVKALLEVHPEITTIVQNINNRKTSMVLGDKEMVLYGKGYIEDILCGKRFRISPKSFYQINSVQTEKLYTRAIELAGFKGDETILDAYCGIGTIGIIASDKVKNVISVELNSDAIADAKINAKLNEIKNVEFYNCDASDFLENLAQNNKKIDAVIMDPPRTGSDKRFLNSVAKLAPEKIVYISCGPDTLARDLTYLNNKGYRAKKVELFDMFPMTKHCEVVCLLSTK